MLQIMLVNHQNMSFFFVSQDEKNQIMTTNVWLIQVCGLPYLALMSLGGRSNMNLQCLTGVSDITH